MAETKTDTEIEETETPSVTREIIATVTAAALVLGLAIGTNILFNKVGTKVHDRIAKNKTEDE
jgi:hypothetical protein